jgi:hypothetical protein
MYIFIYLYSHRRNDSNEYGMTEEEQTLGSGAGANYLDKKRDQNPGRGVPDPATGAKLSPHVFLLVISIYFLGNIYIYVCMSVCVYMFIYVFTYIYIYIYTYIYICIYVYICVYMYIYLHKCMFVYVHMYVYLTRYGLIRRYRLNYPPTSFY